MNGALDVGMDSGKLSARAKQPGHDRSFEESETNFVDALEYILTRSPWAGNRSDWRIEAQPRDLLKIIDGRFGVKPEASITYVPTGRKIYFEVKKQNENGNADERACKHHTVQFYKELHELFGYDYHPYVTIMCDSLGTSDRYVTKHPFYYEEDHYFCWVGYKVEQLDHFISHISRRWLFGAGD